MATALIKRYPLFSRQSTDGPADILPVGDTIVRWVLQLLPYVLAIVATVRPVIDLDIWWHLRVGQDIVAQGSIPTSDWLARTTFGQPWIAYSWLFEVGIYGLYHAFGLLGVGAFRVVMALAIVASLQRLLARQGVSVLVGSVLTGAALAAFIQSLNERPWLFTMLFTIWTLDAIVAVRSRRDSWMIWLLPITYVVWANVHIQFVYGFLFMGLACLAPVIDGFLREPNKDSEFGFGSGRPWQKMLLLSGLCFLATWINPYSVGLFKVVYEYATQPGPYRLVVELTAMDFREVWDWIVLGLAGTAAFCLGRRGTVSIFDLLSLAASAYLSFHMRRDTWVIAIVSPLIIAGTIFRSDPMAALSMVIGPRVLSVALGCLICLIIVGGGRQVSEAAFQKEVATRFPAGAAEYVQSHHVAGPLYNHFNWGGYLTWALPAYPVAIDGRTNLHGDERINRFESTWLGMPGWESDPDLSSASVVIADKNLPLTNLLRADPRFQLAFEDSNSCVFLHK